MDKINNELILEKIKNIESTVTRMENKLEKDYATQEQLRNLREKVQFLQKIVFWFISLILIAVVGWWLSLLFEH